ncbi:unnamed protein product [Plutella xylostella]|uniref:(diamondback moth) hypothetical protein n=1 Tax=Plutella xylostella TaxID=51655 RepID=A0A8S4GD24_PLUXY|nr:unnamed protein product [Plutella xylostella]
MVVVFHLFYNFQFRAIIKEQLVSCSCHNTYNTNLILLCCNMEHI